MDTWVLASPNSLSLPALLTFEVQGPPAEPFSSPSDAELSLAPSPTVVGPLPSQTHSALVAMLRARSLFHSDLMVLNPSLKLWTLYTPELTNGV